MYPDTETQRQLGRERRAELEQEWRLANLARPKVKVVESRRNWRHVQLRWLRDRLRPASNPS
jgi:hypothetical protein